LALQPVVLDYQVLAFDVAGFIEAFTEGGHKGRGAIGRPAVNKSDHRQGQLLRARRERPRRSSTEQRYELASFQTMESHTVAARLFGLQHIDLATVSQRGTPAILQPSSRLHCTPRSAPGHKHRLLLARNPSLCLHLLPKATVIQRIRHPAHHVVLT